ncbi:unnamed protein product [Paramecium octaurelia]|uniref:Uncharacterized protein n=1 Tax=Paramecium octaurelia TaxID=43137 RepID=A0A8S1U4K9_PAROT|nr:unnamed protein product [Paramecium octaurelia]
MNITIETLCKELPNQFADYLRYLKTLRFEDQPDYLKLKDLMKQCSTSNTYDKRFEELISNKIRTLYRKSKFRVHFQLLLEMFESKDLILKNNPMSQILDLHYQMLLNVYHLIKLVCNQNNQSQTHIKIAASQPHMDFNFHIETVDFEDTEENMNNHPTLEQKYLNLFGFDAKLKIKNANFLFCNQCF